jgi:hypothetical protein
LVIRSWTIARAREMREDLADDEVTPLAIVGALCLWLLRLALAPGSTPGGFRRWVVEECPAAPGRTALPAAPSVAVLPAADGAVTGPSHRPVTRLHTHPATVVGGTGRAAGGIGTRWPSPTESG